MRRFNLADSGERGWFIGDFDKAIWRTSAFEVCYQFCPKGDITPTHVHKIAKEISLIATGHVIANGEHYYAGDMFEVDAGETLYCEYVEDTYTVCVKVPSLPTDKYDI